MSEIIIRQATLQDIDALIPLYTGFYQEVTTRVREASRNGEAFREETAFEQPEQKLSVVGLVVSHEAEARRLLRLILESELATIFVAERAGKLIGFIEVALQQSHPGLLSVNQRSGPGYPGSFWLSDPSYIKEGVGRSLMSAAFRWTQEQKAS